VAKTITDFVRVLKYDNQFWYQRVYPYKPPNFTILPVVAVNEYGRKETAVGDDRGLNETKTVIVIDIWQKQMNNALIEAMKMQVLNLVYSNFTGVELIASRDIPEHDGDIHIIMEFSAI
jgi:hypothetical protein